MSYVGYPNNRVGARLSDGMKAMMILTALSEKRPEAAWFSKLILP
jgi:hypothetical protein